LSRSENIDPKGVAKLKKYQKKVYSTTALVRGILSQDKTALGKAITLVESMHSKHQEQAKAVIEQCLQQKKNSVRIGITGVPGVGKSTFIETFGKELTSHGKKVAVLAVDPTSTISSGSILGDKTRMEELAKDPNAFIRPSPSGNSLGGVARKTRETVILCEAAGYDSILIETVGVGQSETAVHSMVDFFLLLKLAGAGDELQGIKRGIVEMADAIVINKADGDNLNAAKTAKEEFARALHLFPPKDNHWIPKTLICSAIENKGISEVWKMIEDYAEEMRKDNRFETKRIAQNKYWLLQFVEDQLKLQFYQNPAVKEKLKELLSEVSALRMSPFTAAEKLLELR